ncbi:MAG: hypothetical protein LUQ66_03770 [Methanoregula sp.]|nr:hypothetical protein [Methanoregula sp.]
MVKKSRSRTVSEIPLHLLPQAVARQVRDWGDAVHRISIRRTHWHHFNVTVRTKPVPRELASRVTATYSFPNVRDTTGIPAAAGRRRGSPA